MKLRGGRMSHMRLGSPGIAAVEQLFSHQQVALHLGQHGLLVFAAGGRLSSVAGCTAFASLSAFRPIGQQDVLGGVQRLRARRWCVQQDAASGTGGHAEAQEQLDGALGSGHGGGESAFIVPALTEHAEPQWHRRR